MADAGHEYAEGRIEAVTNEIQAVYAEAAAKAEEELRRHLERFEAKDEEFREAVEAGQASKKDWQAWRKRQMIQGRRWRELAQRMAEGYTSANQAAAQVINGELPAVAAENANYGAYQVDSAAGVDTSFSLQDEGTVHTLLSGSEAFLPQVAVAAAADIAWNRKGIQSAVTQGILLGESIPKIAKRMQSVGAQNRAQAVRWARTYTTAAENAGRVASYERARKMGIKLKQEWLATLDGRTRHSHRQLDGERREVGKKFSNGCRYPGDPQAAYAEICNCRCTLVAAVDGIDQDSADRFSRLPAGTTYEQWKAGKVKLGLGSGGNTNNTMRRVGTIDVSDDAAVRAYVEKVKAEIRNESVEHAIVIQKDGVVMRGSGNGTSVSLDGSTVEGATVIHNHPTKDAEHIAPGADDYAVLLEQKPRTLIAVDSEYDYSLEPGSTESVSYNEAYRNGLNPFGDADQQHNIMEWLNDNGYVRFSREAVRSDGRASC